MHHLSPSTPFLCLTQVFLSTFSLLPALTGSLPVLISSHPLSLMCLFYFAQSCVMTKSSLPGCMQSVLVSCPYEVWGPSEFCQSYLTWPSQAQEEGLKEGDSCPHPVLCCLALMKLHKHKPHELIEESLIHASRLMFFLLSPLFSWTAENADMRLPGTVHFSVLLLLPYSYKFQNGSGLFTIHQVLKG